MPEMRLIQEVVEDHDSLTAMWDEISSYMLPMMGITADHPLGLTLKNMFMAGAFAVFHTFMVKLAPGPEVTEGDQRLADNIFMELSEFSNEMSMRTARARN